MIGDLKVKDAMHDQPVTCGKHTPVNEVAETMVRLHIHRIIVVEDQRPVGIISSLDLVQTSHHSALLRQAVRPIESQ